MHIHMHVLMCSHMHAQMHACVLAYVHRYQGSGLQAEIKITYDMDLTALELYVVNGLRNFLESQPELSAIIHSIHERISVTRSSQRPDRQDIDLYVSVCVGIYTYVRTYVHMRACMDYSTYFTYVARMDVCMYTCIHACM